MKTLDPKKSEELFNKIKNLSRKIDRSFGGAVQNPDFVNEKIAQDNYNVFNNQHKNILKELNEIKEEVFEMHKEIKPDLER